MSFVAKFRPGQPWFENSRHANAPVGATPKAITVSALD